MQSFEAYVSQLTPNLPDAARQAIAQVTHRQTFAKRTLLLRAGEVCTHFHYIERGLARVFYYRNDQEITAWFGFEGQIISAIDSFFTGQVSEYWIEMLEDSQVCSVSNAHIEWLFAQHPATERLGRLMITENYLRLDERMKLFAFHTAEERYARLLEQFPAILQRVPLHVIASYLGITQVTLSRIRASYRP